MLEDVTAELDVNASPDSKTAAKELREIFLAAPMSGYPTEEGYRETRRVVLGLIEALKAARPDAEVYFAGAGIASKAEFSEHKLALETDLQALRRAEVFVMVYPERLTSSVLIEAGYALALRIPAVVCVRRKADLPYLFHEAEDLAGAALVPDYIEILEYSDEQDLAYRVNASISQIERGG